MKIDDFKKVKIEAMKAHDKDAVAALNVVINKLMLAGIEKKAAGEETRTERKGKKQPFHVFPPFALRCPVLRRCMQRKRAYIHILFPN